ncbi:hypothetical protein ACTWPM_15295 [Halobacillus sp. K22]
MWLDGSVAESYPGQGKVKDIEVISKGTPAHAQLSEAEAIRKAISKVQDQAPNKVEEDNQFPIVTSSQFNEKQNHCL